MGGNQVKHHPERKINSINRSSNLLNTDGMFEKGKVVKIIDNNTISIAGKIPQNSDNAFLVYKFRCKINGISTPRIDSPRQSESSIAELVRNYLADMLLNKIVTLTNVKYDGDSLVADIELDGINIAKDLLEKRMALPNDRDSRLFEIVDWSIQFDPQ